METEVIKQEKLMTNKEWLSSLDAEDFYDMFKKAEEKGKWDINTRCFMIQWLNQKHTQDVEAKLYGYLPLTKDNANQTTP